MATNLIHPNMKRLKRLASVAIAGCASGVLETILLVMLIRGQIGAGPAALLHAAIVAALGLWTYRSRSFRGDIGWPLLLTTSVAVLGPLGALGTFLTMGLTKFYARSATPFEKWYASLLPEHQIGHDTPLFRRIRTAPRSSIGLMGVAPFIDILAFGDLAEKQKLIGLITKHFQPAFSPILLLALGDANNTIRVQAASAVVRIQDTFVAGSIEISNEVKSHPANPELLLALATHYDQYAAAGLLDPELEAITRDSALEAYQKYLTLKPGDEHARAAAGRLLVRAARSEEALEWLDNNIAGGRAGADTVVPYMEGLFSLRRFSELRSLAARYYNQLAGDESVPAKAMEAIKLWAAQK